MSLKWERNSRNKRLANDLRDERFDERILHIKRRTEKINRTPPAYDEEQLSIIHKCLKELN